MIDTPRKYEKACQELKDLESWLDRLRQENPGPQKGLTKAGIRKMIARIQEELAYYEGGLEVAQAEKGK